ncbi:hypothetical protein [uncultured Oscillibacter sp.]|uniref:hypothetical protein n=1 Tax=uncultured Oscillibacter sp. TaxID=876091 RepID=UPI0025F58977|nr:hypothetical protein [uncultured Oscillibacter sp.]
MNKDNDNVLSLLQDIKELLFGAVLILAGWIFILAPFNEEIPLWICGLPFFAYGGFHVWNGWTKHELVEKNGETQKEEEQGGPHAL